MATVGLKHSRKESPLYSSSSSSSTMRSSSQKSITTPTPGTSSISSSSQNSRQKSTMTTPPAVSISRRRMSIDDDDSDDDDDDANIPQLSDLAKRLLGNADGLGEGGNVVAQKFSSSSLKRKQDDGSDISGGSGSRRDSYRGTSESRSGSPSRRDFVTPAVGRQFRRPTAAPGSAHNSGGSSSSGSGKREPGPNETPAYSTITRPTGSVARQWQTTTKRPTRGLTLGMPIRGPKRDPEAQSAVSPDEMMGQDNPLAQPAPSFDIEGKTPSESGSAGKSSTHSRSASRYSRHPSPELEVQQSSGSPPPKIAKYTSSAERERQRRDGSPELRRSPSRRSPAVQPEGSPVIQAADPIEDRARVSPVHMISKRSSAQTLGRSQSHVKLSSGPAPVEPSHEDIDKENAPVISFKKPVTSSKPTKVERDAGSPPQKPAAAPVQERTTPRGPALASRSSNTPHRMAPPPPKMPSAIQMQTARAGAAAASTTKRQNVVVNGIKYLRLDQIGRGGSAKVYRVMAENYKMMAMKKVVFEQQDEMVIRGFKGEIDLLKKLKDVDRVVRLYDFEVNEDKGTLTVLLECGELDLNRMLSARHGGDDSQLDLSFIRYYWKEMIECVDAVHRHNIVHSDLKPANFVLVQGRLKLIDFGIANAIQDDTVNVHREAQVGTISYMSPEAIADYNQGMSAPGGSRLPRLFKLGAPSDVWSLGCILYQMTYGRTPFAHLPNMYSKMQAIPNPKFEINYPSTGIGGVPVPRSLIYTMKGCLERDKNKRVTIRELLSEEDRFLNPDREKEGVVDVSEDTLISLLENACEYTKDKGAPTAEQVKIWGKDVFSKLKRKMFERKSWGR